MKLFAKADIPRSMLLGIVETDTVARALKSATHQFPDVEVKIKTTEDALADASRLVNGSGDLVLVECDVADPRAVPTLKRLAEYVGVAGHLIVLARNADAARVRDLFRMGASDVLDLPVSEQELSQAIASAFQTARSTGKAALGRMVSLLKCGGGAGATTIALNLAHNISSRRKVVSGKSPRVLVLDMDLQFGSVASAVGASNSMNLINLVQKAESFDVTHLETAIISVAPNFDILASPAEIIPMSVLTGDFLKLLMTAARERYDYVILDLPQTWSTATAHVLRMSDAIIPVALPTVEHARAAATILNGLDEIDVSRETVLFAHNRVRGVSHKDRINSIDKMTQRPSIQIPEDAKVHDTSRNHAKLLHEVGGSKAQVKAVTRLTDRLFEILNTPLRAKQPAEAAVTEAAAASPG